MIDRLVDADNDGQWAVGYHDGADCDDQDPNVGPTQIERCLDQVDNDCDGLVDEDGVNDVSIYPDRDHDGQGDAGGQVAACYVVEGWSDNALDCDDARNDIFSGAPEQCNERDDNCDGIVDEGAPGTTWYFDADADGFGRDDATVIQCHGPGDYVDRGGDCDDLRADVHPTAFDLPYDGEDRDCSGTSDFDQDGDGFLSPLSGSAVPDCDDDDPNVRPDAPESFYDGVDQDCDPTNELDADGDGVDSASFGGTDCDDTTTLVRPGAAETWYDGIDQDCDPTTEWDQDDDGYGVAGSPHPRPVDCQDQNPTVGPPSPWYRDDDRDGWGLESDAVESCAPIAGRVTRLGDCDDHAGDVSPEDPEVCGGADEDCDGYRDESGGETVWRDNDADGHGDPQASEIRCPPFFGWVSTHDDCDDTNGLVAPGVPEVCNRIDDDCDQVTDEAGGPWWFEDGDGDGFGDMFAVPVARCNPEPGWSLSSDDCDDSAASVNPLAFDTCDGDDSNCDGHVDEDGLEEQYLDVDGDGYGAEGAFRCPEDGWVDVGGDCQDEDEDVNPGAIEICDGLDNNCDGPIDPGLRAFLRPDRDGDGYAWALSPPEDVCRGTVGYTDVVGDCDDAEPTTFPDATEVCDGVDQNCNTTIDDGLRADLRRDGDGDGYVDVRDPVENVCADAPGFSDLLGDCDDHDVSQHPGVPEVCDGRDEDCSGVADDDLRAWLRPDGDGDGLANAAEAEEFVCRDAGGYTNVVGDCDDGAADVHPGATETCDRRDEDCDGAQDEGLRADQWMDRDGDGFGAGPGFPDSCLRDGAVTNGADCDDGSSAVHPNTNDPCDGVDQDCDGDVDDGQRVLMRPDPDRDGFADALAAQPESQCPGTAGWTPLEGDCDEGDPLVYPQAPERCNNLDDDCDAVPDDGVRGDRYQDLDGDGYGGAFLRGACTLRPHLLLSGGDCDDRDETVHPDVSDPCGGGDQDCDGVTDDDSRDHGFADADGDGYGATNAPLVPICAPFTGFAVVAGDCDDGDGDINPAIDEVCDAIDNDCDGALDNGVRFPRHRDADGDGAGIPSLTASICYDEPGYSDNGDDCDDTNPDTYAGAFEVCDALDNDCDPTTRMDIVDPLRTVTGARTWSTVCEAWRFEWNSHVYLVPDVLGNPADPYDPAHPFDNSARDLVSWDAAWDWCEARGYGMWVPDTQAFFNEADILSLSLDLLPVDTITPPATAGGYRDPTNYHMAVVEHCSTWAPPADAYYTYGHTDCNLDGDVSTREACGVNCVPIPTLVVNLWSLSTAFLGWSASIGVSGPYRSTNITSRTVEPWYDNARTLCETQ